MKISNFSKSIFIALCTIFLLLPSISRSGSQKTASLHVTSDQMIVLRNKSMVEFTGNVKAVRMDSTVIADSMKIFFTEDSPDKGNDTKNNIKQIISTGNVEYTAGERKAYADKAVYNSLNETLTLTGNAARLVTGTSFVTGEKITLYRNQDKIIVESKGEKRVEALFNPEDKSSQ